MHELHGFAIVSDDDRIADAAGNFPDALKNDADWTYFQAGLDATELVLIGRRSHEASPNHRGRHRVVVSATANRLERRADAVWWNPARLGLTAMLSELLPEGGNVGVPGGQAVFDLVGASGFASFHLARAHGTLLPGGRGLFAACEAGVPAAQVLAGGGLVADSPIWLDQPARVSLAVWRR